MAEKSNRNVKKRNWAFVLWPDSAPGNWREQLEKTGLPCAVGPLHDKDINPDGSPKKPHYHVILCYAGPTSYSVVKRLTDHLRQSRPEPLEQIRGYYRYLTHMDNPEKAQYSASDIVPINGFNIRDYVELTKSEVLKILGEVQDFIRDNDIVEYCDLLDILRDGDGMGDWHDVAMTHTLMLTNYLRSRREKRKGRAEGDGR